MQFCQCFYIILNFNLFAIKYRILETKYEPVYMLQKLHIRSKMYLYLRVSMSTKAVEYTNCTWAEDIKSVPRNKLLIASGGL